MRPDEQLRAVPARFAGFADEARGRSPLYVWLSEAVAEDASLASALAAASRHQRRPNLLFAAVHDILLAGADHELRRYYPSVGGSSAPDEGTTPAFRSFLEEHPEAIVARVAERRTQTNEPGRCAAIRPGLARLATLTSRPVALVELGASAGLLLHLDRYAYRYGARPALGPDGAEVTISCEVRGAPPPSDDLPVITHRIGVDLDPLSPGDEDDARWLRACVWPDDVARLARLDAALEVARDHDDVRLVRGDIVSDLPSVVDGIAGDALVCVIHSAALAYLDDAARLAVHQHLDRIGAQRDLARICFEGPFIEPFASEDRRLPTASRDEDHFVVGLSSWTDGRRSDELIARSHPHGAWLEWLLPRADPVSGPSRHR